MALSGWVIVCHRGTAYITSICAFQLSMRSSMSSAITPTLIDSTMFLVEILQPLVLRHLLLQRGIELAVLNGNAEIAAQSFQQFHVFAGEEVSLRGFAQA